MTSTCSMCRRYSGRISDELDRAPRARRRPRCPKTAPTSSFVPAPPPTCVGHPPGRVGADGEEGAVREVEHAHQPVDERQAGRDQEVHRPEPEPGDREQDEGAHVGWPPLPWHAEQRPHPLRVGEQLRGRAGVHDAARVEHDDVLRHAARRRRGSARRAAPSRARRRARARPRPRSRAAARAPSSARRRAAPGCRSGARGRSRPSAAGRPRACRRAARRASGARGRARRRGRSARTPFRSASRRFSSTVRPAKTSRSSGT